MKEQQLHLITLSGLLHDIGKLLERGEIFQEVRSDGEYLRFCKDDKNTRRPTHLHAAHTAKFCEWVTDRFRCLNSLDNREWITWCAAHHRDDELDKEASIIRISDRLSSSERDEGDYYAKDIHRRTLLEPVLERVSLPGYPDSKATSYRYPLEKLTSEKESFFPCKGTDIKIRGRLLDLEAMPDAAGPISDRSAWKHLVAQDSRIIIEGYKALGEELIADIDALSKKCPEISLPDLVQSLLALLERFSVNVPSATNLRHPDISLFDHLRSTAAIAQALHMQCAYEGHFPVDMSAKDTTPRWLLVCGDFSGIQKFIYNLTNKGAAKGLRGRSFFVSHFCRLCADYILRELGLSKAALLYNSGGKFYLLIPRFKEDRLYALRRKINAWLIDEFDGEVFLGLGCAEITAKMFVQGNMHEAWKTCNNNLERDRVAKFSDLLDNRFFEPNDGYNPVSSCKVCGTRRVSKENERCGNCKMLETIGSLLNNTEIILTVWGDDVEKAKTQLKLDDERCLPFKGIGAHCILLSNEQMDGVTGLGLIDAECIFLNRFADKNLAELPLPQFAFSFMYLAKWEKQRCVDERGNPWDFSMFAEASKGVKRLGILRMDVDSLGKVFIEGLQFLERENNGWGKIITKNGKTKRRSMASISRMVTLSRQLNHFFASYLPKLLEEENFSQCQIIYSGGDDVFVIGSWNQLPALAEKLRSEFKSFCCENSVFSISGGLTLQHGKYPIYKGAQMAGKAEKSAKEVRKKWNKCKTEHEKDGFCFLGVPMLWEDFKIAKEIKMELETDFKKNKGLLGFLSRISADNLVCMERIRKEKEITVSKAWAQLIYASWRWRTAYYLRRRYGTKEEDKTTKWSGMLFDNDNAALPVISWLALPLRWTELFNRE